MQQTLSIFLSTENYINHLIAALKAYVIIIKIFTYTIL